MPSAFATCCRAEALTRYRRHVARQAGLAATHQHGCRSVTAMTRLSTPRRVTARLRAERRVLRAGDKAVATLPTPRREASMPDPLRRMRRVAEHRHRPRQVARHGRSPKPAVVAGFVSAAFNRSSLCSSSRSAPGACSTFARWTTARTRRNAIATQAPSSARRVLHRKAACRGSGLGPSAGRTATHPTDTGRREPSCASVRQVRWWQLSPRDGSGPSQFLASRLTSIGRACPPPSSSQHVYAPGAVPGETRALARLRSQDPIH